MFCVALVVLVDIQNINQFVVGSNPAESNILTTFPNHSLSHSTFSNHIPAD